MWFLSTSLSLSHSYLRASKNWSLLNAHFILISHHFNLSNEKWIKLQFENLWNVASCFQIQLCNRQWCFFGLGKKSGEGKRTSCLLTTCLSKLDRMPFYKNYKTALSMICFAALSFFWRSFYWNQSRFIGFWAPLHSHSIKFQVWHRGCALKE